MQTAMLIVAIIAAITTVANTIISLWQIRLVVKQQKTLPSEGIEPEKANEMKAKAYRKISFLCVRMVAFVVVLVAVLWLRIQFFPPDLVLPPLPATVYDFENDMQGWGEHPEGEVHVSGQGVEVYRDNLSPISKTGNSSLKFIPTKIIKNNAYVTVLENAQGTTIKAYIFVPSGADISTAHNNSTAKIVVWDKSWTAHESGFMELDSGVWQPISWNLLEQEWPGPWREFGIHFYFVTDYKGQIYIDTVTLEK